MCALGWRARCCECGCAVELLLVSKRVKSYGKAVFREGPADSRCVGGAVFNLVSRFVEGTKGEHSHNSSFTSDVTADTALSEGLTTVYRNDPRLGAMP